jgi:hypothetical protein
MQETIFKYNDTDYDLSIIAPQAATAPVAEVELKDIDVVIQQPSKYLLAVPKGDRYEVIAGSLQIDQKTQLPYNKQRVRIAGKHLMKKAKLENIQQRKENVAQSQREQNDRYNDRYERRPYSDRNNGFGSNYGDRNNDRY